MAGVLLVEQELEKLYEIKTQVLGSGAATQEKVLDVIVSWCEVGCTLEAEPRHAKLVIEQLGIKSAGGLTIEGAAKDVSKRSSRQLEDEVCRCSAALRRGQTTWPWTVPSCNA